MRTILPLVFLAFLGQANAQKRSVNFPVTTGCLGTPSCFSDSQVNHTSWSWDFGDGSIICCNDPNPCHTYSVAGTFTVTLLASDNNGNKDTVLFPVGIHLLPVVNFSASSGSNGVSFTDLSTAAGAAIVAWYWTFPGGSPATSALQNPGPVMYPAGTYSACLVVTTSSGCADAGCQAIIISSVNENDIPNTVSIFPNPFQSQATLKTGLSLKDATLVVYNSFGQQVRKLENISGSLVTLYRDNLPRGLYFIRLEQNDRAFTTGKFIVQDN